MFGLFKKKSAVEKLQQHYERLMKESHKLSQSDRKAGDAKYAEAEAVLQQIEKLK